MKRAVEDSLFGANFNSPVANGKSKKLKLFHGTDSPDLSEEAKYSEYGSKMKLVEEIVLMRNGRLKVALKFKNNSAFDSSGAHSTFANNAFATTPARVEDDEDVHPQNSNPTPVLEDLNYPSVVSGVLDDRKGIEESPNDAGTFEIIDLGDDADEKGPDIAEECSMSKKVPDESQINLLSKKSLKPLVLDNSKEIEESPNDVRTFETIDLEDNANGKGHEVADECYVGNKVPDKSQINILLEKSPRLDYDTTSDGKAVLKTELDDMWMEFGFAIEISKENAGLDNSVHDNTNNKPNEDCEHSLILRDDIGYVCRVCGKVEMEIQKIFEFQYKTPRSSRTYKREPRFQGRKDPLEIPAYGIEISENEDLTNFSTHPRHAKQMKPHQVEGFRFLERNLVSDKPSGCILAHAPCYCTSSSRLGPCAL